jgi:hypothetical protein
MSRMGIGYRVIMAIALVMKVMMDMDRMIISTSDVAFSQSFVNS